jgi:hypothetical protein
MFEDLWVAACQVVVLTKCKEGESRNRDGDRERINVSVDLGDKKRMTRRGKNV